MRVISKLIDRMTSNQITRVKNVSKVYAWNINWV